MKNDNPVFCRCLRCNRKLKTEEAKKRGYGDYCWKEHKKEVERNHTCLFKIVF